MLAERWWFWVLAAVVATGVAATEPAWRRAAVRARARAMRRRLVEPGPGTSVDTEPSRPWSEVWLPAVLLGAWVCASPWIWGYEEVDGAVATDVVTGTALAALSAAGVMFPAALALNVFGGLWLVTAPWLVGYGTHGGAVGLSDTLAGLATCALALRGLTAATNRLRAAQPGPIGRVRTRDGS